MSVNLVYLHGFLSSPQSVKAQQTLNYMQQHHPDVSLFVPELPPYPTDTLALLESLISGLPEGQLRFIGSSMGGYLSTYLVERFGGKAVVINPAVRPYELLVDYLGEHKNPYTGKRFTLFPEHMTELKVMDTTTLKQPECYWALLQTGDETLDYRQAENKYQGAKVTVEEGGDHSFQGYEDHLPAIASFLFENTTYLTRE